MIQTPVLPDSLAQDTTFAILSAGSAPGPTFAERAAALGAGVVAMDADPAALAKVVGQSPAKIEGLALVGDPVARLEPLRRTWGATPLHLMLNLMPFDTSATARNRIDDQIRGLSASMRALGLGLAAGQGAVVTVLPRPTAPLALSGRGLIAAIAEANDALAEVFAPRGVRFYTLTVPEGAPDLAVGTALFLGSEMGRHLRSGRIDLD